MNPDKLCKIDKIAELLESKIKLLRLKHDTSVLILIAPTHRKKILEITDKLIKKIDEEVEELLKELEIQ